MDIDVPARMLDICPECRANAVSLSSGREPEYRVTWCSNGHVTARIGKEVRFTTEPFNQ